MPDLDRLQLQRELAALPSQLAARLALRAAMRVWPVLLSGQPPGALTSAALRVAQMTLICQAGLFRGLGEAGPSRQQACVTGASGAVRSIALSPDADFGRTAAVLAMLQAANAGLAALVPVEKRGDGASVEHAATEAILAAAAAVPAAEREWGLAAFNHDIRLALRPASTPRWPSLRPMWPFGRQTETAVPGTAAADLLACPLWPRQAAAAVTGHWEAAKQRLLALDAGFDLWTAWYDARLAGEAWSGGALEEAASTLSKEQLARAPAQLNAHLRSVVTGQAKRELKRVRAIFIGHGGVGKTSLVKALLGQEVVEGREAMTKGVAILDTKPATAARDGMPPDADVYTTIHDLAGKNIAVHFWDFGGQVMAQATHQFFLRSGCLYVIVLDARREHHPNEEAEYWLEHVRAFGDSSPVLLVGNKADEIEVNLEMRKLKEKYPNIIRHHSISCTHRTSGRLKASFDAFSSDFEAALLQLGERGERFTDAQFRVLQAAQEAAAAGDFLPHARFDEMCVQNGIEAEGRDSLLELFDQLGIVINFRRLPFLTDYLLNPRWLTFGVYAIIYSDIARDQKGQISEADVVTILRSAQVADTDPARRAMRFGPDRCSFIVGAMIEFGVAYRVAGRHLQLVIPALLESDQPAHSFKSDGGMEFQLVFAGFLPRHVLPLLVCEHNRDIAEERQAQVVWQNGVLLRPRGQRGGLDAEALVRADYHDRTIDILATGSDANAYVGQLRASIRRTLSDMPELRYDENVRLRPSMLAGPGRLPRPDDRPIWISYDILLQAQRDKAGFVYGRDGKYDLDKVFAVVPLSPDVRPADVFISYAHADKALADRLAQGLEAAGYSIWLDHNLVPGMQWRQALDERIDAAKAVVVLWTAHSVGQRFVIHEASRAGDLGKLVCLKADDLPMSKIPAPFAANDQIGSIGDASALAAALARKGVVSRVD